MSKRSSREKRSRPRPPPPSTATSASDFVRRRADAASVALLALVCALPGITNQFVYDDVGLIQDNARAHDLANWGRILTSAYWPPPFVPQLYRPVASLLTALEYAIGFGSPMVFRVVSYGLYAAVAVALFRFASKLLPRPTALAIVALFAVHPVHVEAVALGVNQGELLVALIAIVMTQRYVVRRSSGALTVGDWVVLALLYASAALTKENGFVLPALLVAAELFVVRQRAEREGGTGDKRSRRSLVAGFSALAVVGAALLLVRMAILNGSATGAVPAEALVGVGFGRRALTMLQVVPTWLRLLTWPAHLQADYSPNEIVASVAFGAREAAGLLLAIAVIALAWIARRRGPLVTFGFAWMAIALFPVSNLVVPTGVVVAERTLFLPSVGFVIAIGALGWQFVEVTRMRWPASGRALATVCLALAALGAGRSVTRQLVWNNNQRLAAATARDAPRSLAVQQAHRDAVAALIKDFQARIDTASQPWMQRNQFAMLLHAIGEDNLALEQLRLSLAVNPRQPEVAAEIAQLRGDSSRGPAPRQRRRP
jgi:protein O-mannosyl-transferase